MESQRIRTLAMLAVGLAGVAVMAQSQTVGIAGGRALPGPEYTDPRSAPPLTHRMTKTFQQAPLAEVLAWMSLNEASFVADASLIPDARTISVSFEDHTLAECMQMVAAQVEGRWDANGEIFTLRPINPSQVFANGNVIAMEISGGMTNAVSPATAAAASRARGAEAAAPAATMVPQHFSGAYSLGTNNYFSFAVSLVGTPETVTAEWIGGEMAQDRSFSDEWAKQFDQRLRSIELRLDRLESTLRGAPTADATSFKELRAATQEARKAISMAPISGQMTTPMTPVPFIQGQATAPISPIPPVAPVPMKPMPPLRMKGDKVDDAWIKEVEQWARDFAESQAKWAEQMEKTHAELAKQMAEVKVSVPDAEFMKQWAKDMAEFRLERLDPNTLRAQRHAELLVPLKELRLNPNADLRKLFSSLTPEQKFAMQKRGYLRAAELTPEQRAILGDRIPTSGKWEVTYSLDGQKVTIRSN
ncbi:MAG: hypothetical protein ACK4XJ_05050 [Fimbriimonadaceae bacterium]